MAELFVLIRLLTVPVALTVASRAAVDTTSNLEVDIRVVVAAATEAVGADTTVGDMVITTTATVAALALAVEATLEVQVVVMAAAMVVVQMLAMAAAVAGETITNLLLPPRVTKLSIIQDIPLASFSRHTKIFFG